MGKIPALNHLKICAQRSKAYTSGLIGNIVGTVAEALDEIVKNMDDAVTNLQGQINGKADTNHGTHVPSVCLSITDWNNATANGWYMASGASNAPTSGSVWYFGRVIAHNTNYLIQEVYQFTASSDAKAIPKYIRARTNGTWGAWTNVTVAKAVPADAKFTDTNTTYSAATQSAGGLMSADDKKKLDGVSAGANVYTHPSTHEASMITQDATHRFVSDTEKSAWNAKADKEHTHSYAGSSNAGGAADLANQVAGVYTANGGQQPPSYVGSGRVRFNMMNGFKGLSNLPTYADCMLMDTYAGSDVPYITGLGIVKASGSPRAFIAVGKKGDASTWAAQTELLTAAGRPVATAVTIPISGWGSDSTAGYPKYYDIAVSGITANDRASVTIAAGSLAAAKACGMCQTNETLEGKIRIRAANVPTSAIAVQYWIEKGKG